MPACGYPQSRPPPARYRPESHFEVLRPCLGSPLSSPELPAAGPSAWETPASSGAQPIARLPPWRPRGLQRDDMPLEFVVRGRW